MTIQTCCSYAICFSSMVIRPVPEDLGLLKDYL